MKELREIPGAHDVPCADEASLVRRIHLINGAWHALRDLWPSSESADPTLRALRLLKSNLQAQLLRKGPPVAYLVLDADFDLREPCYSVRLHQPVDGKTDACHLPVRVARECLTASELQRLERPRA